MKKRTLYFLGAGLLIILTIAYNISDLSVMNLIPRASLPGKYKSYRDIRDGIVSDHYRSELLFRADDETRFGDFPPLYNAANNTVIVDRQTDKKTGEKSDYFETYLKLDADGTVIDSLKYYDNWPQNWAGFLIARNGYCSWMLDGDKQIHPYIEQNKALTEDSAYLSQHFKRLYQTAQIVFYYSHFDLNDNPLQDSLKIDKALFYMQGKWIALYGKNLSELDSHGFPTKNKSSINGMVNRVNQQNLVKINAYIYMDHFQKEHFDKAQGPSLGSPTGSSTPDQWEGSAYFNIILKKDTLHFVQDMMKDELDWEPADPAPYVPPTFIYYFTCAQLNFGLFTNDYLDLFLIKKKVK